MKKTKKSERVPQTMKQKYHEISAITDNFCEQYLNQEYAELIRYAIAALCRKRPSPLIKGRATTWAGGITHAIGMVNFLFDKSQTPNISASELYEAYDISQSAGQSKSKEVRNLLNMSQFDPNWSLPSKLDDNPMAWMISVNGYIVDVRQMPQDVQEAAYKKGLIPYIPETQPSSKEKTTV